MDAAYLKKNVMEALTEGLTSMSIKTPEDQIEFLGRYLLQYVERKQKASGSEAELAIIENNYAQFQQEEDIKSRIEADKNQLKSQFESRHNKFVSSLTTDYDSKKGVMDSVTNYIEQTLDVPGAYIAVKRTVGETDTLHYLSAGPSQGHVVGKKLTKVIVDESEEGGPQRQGISFEAFKVPEVPEEEAAEEVEGEERPPKPVLKAQPLVVDNTMREKRVKFFGIPKLGSFVAVPFSYQSVDHDASCVYNAGTPAGEAGEDGSPGTAAEPAGYTLATKECQFLICIDSVGKYRTFKPDEITRISAIGEELIRSFERIEGLQGAAQLKYMADGKFASMGEVSAALTAKIAEEEPNALANAAAAVTAAGEGVSELLKPLKESEAVLSLWSSSVGSANFAVCVLSLKNHVLPLPLPAVSLLFAVACLLQYPSLFTRDICGDPSWDALRENCLSDLVSKISAYSPSAPRATAESDGSLASVKGLAEVGNLFDASIYPPNLPIFAVLSGWLQKALAAREAAVAYAAEVDKVNLEEEPVAV